MKLRMRATLVLAAVGAVLGAGAGAADAAPPETCYTCYSMDGGPNCDICVNGCLGGDYICCCNSEE